MSGNTDCAADTAPVAIGGIGGSGTRLVAELLRSLGFFLGSDLNASSDTLWFTLLFKRLEILQCDDAEFDRLTCALVSGLRGGQPLDAETAALVRQLAGDDRPQHDAAWLRQRAESLFAAANQPARPGRWGWKEPNTHIVIERLWARVPELRYVHVVRHGVDMAFSANQNQLRLWGPRVLGQDRTATPADSLSYWCHVHQRMQALLDASPRRMHWLDYDALCRDPAVEATKLCAFLETGPDHLQPLLEKVRPPDIPRHATIDIAGFDPLDIAYVRSLGYVVHDNHRGAPDMSAATIA